MEKQCYYKNKLYVIIKNKTLLKSKKQVRY